MEATENQTLCGQCDYECTSLDDLVKHVKATPNHTTRCVPCNVQYKTFPIFRKHLKMFHFKTVSEYVCADCGKVSHTEEANLKHFNHNHRRDADMYCNFCAKDMLNMERLRKHTKVCMFKDPAQTDLLRRDNEEKNPAVKDLIQVWSFDHFLAWQKESMAKIKEKELEKLTKTSPVKRKRNTESPAKKPKKMKSEQDNGNVSKVEEAESKPNLNDLAKGKVLNDKVTDERKIDLNESKEDLNVTNDNDNESESDKSENDFVAGFNDFYQTESTDDEFENVKVEVQVKEEMPSDVDNNEDGKSDSDSSDDEGPPVKPEDVKEESKIISFERRDKSMINGEAKAYSCAECGKGFVSYSGYRKHLRKVHPELFPDESDDKPNDHKEKRNCKECGKEFDSYGGYRKHLRKVHPDLFLEMTQHRKDNHTILIDKIVENEDGTFMCTADNCEDVFMTREELVDHITETHKNREKGERLTKVCLECGKTVKHLSSHMKAVHPNEDPVNCTECDKEFKSKFHLKKHVQDVHEGASVSKKEKQLSPCPLCGKEVKYLKVHLEVHERQENPNYISPKKVIEEKMCPICGKSVKHLRTHIDNVHAFQGGKGGEFPCEECGSVYKTKEYLLNHIRNVHKIATSVDTEIICDVCSKGFKNRIALNTHKKRQHGEKGFFPCKTCNIVFDAKHKLYVHDYNVHRMEEMHCEICGATCKNKKQMYDHMRKIHPGGQMKVKHKKEMMSPPFHIPQY